MTGVRNPVANKWKNVCSRGNNVGILFFKIIDYKNKQQWYFSTHQVEKSICVLCIVYNYPLIFNVQCEIWLCVFILYGLMPRKGWKMEIIYHNHAWQIKCYYVTWGFAYKVNSIENISGTIWIIIFNHIENECLQMATD